ncbi:DUF2630 family protein [Nocardiopsis algeriensis]|uniref:DUF2630 family protein n=1 Tax=Nocardiopsis algeriensis TaxID=1478215 RepID=A0A841IM35_9ACTN|nr:DUF2630 family protein [Nocardiopsis algeriensis]MBB6119230.1 hypothetical protein [Nocardiopsis algeriensis]
MSDRAEKDILATIESLMEEERALRATPGGLSPQEGSRMREVERSLDQCWDLLRQRRARAEQGRDPDEAEVRPASQVEDYPQ